MNDFLDIPTLIAIVVAIIVIVRLRSVLGTRTGNERSPLERSRPTNSSDGGDKSKQTDNVVPINPGTAPAPAALDDERRARKLEAEIERYSHGDKDVAEGLQAIGEADPGFMPKSFMEGAKGAYEMVVTAFAQGDRKTLKNLLDKDVYDGFEAAIAERESLGHTVDFTFVGLPKIEISDAGLDKKTAHLTIQYDAEVVSATHDKDGNLIEGNAENVVTISDEWTFARTVRSRDPNWKLVATNQLD